MAACERSLEHGLHIEPVQSSSGTKDWHEAHHRSPSGHSVFGTRARTNSSGTSERRRWASAIRSAIGWWRK
jgi:hypothetical protein